ncbi:hypothetical protein BDA96_10G214600 [Sorghum bicolor]|uniref:Uncharacterized protein n=1 Tax=Sorghum bicolor TaxID=4558 RepID=A0A921U1H8_SORBI|nr:hypothetical protein BDA96_10G214600 [Sorghum bicolor]
MIPLSTPGQVLMIASREKDRGSGTLCHLLAERPRRGSGKKLCSCDVACGLRRVQGRGAARMRRLGRVRSCTSAKAQASELPSSSRGLEAKSADAIAARHLFDEMCQ